MEEKTKDQRIKSEFNKLKKLCNGLPKNKLAVALPLIEQAAFMRVTLTDLQKEINEAGCVVVGAVARSRGKRKNTIFRASSQRVSRLNYRAKTSRKVFLPMYLAMTGSP